MAEVVDVRARVLAANEEAAAQLRKAFSESGALVLNLISPGSGKTTPGATVRALGRPRLRGSRGHRHRADADRLRALGIPACRSSLVVLTWTRARCAR
jgi:hypothetical protein